jgi:hypothetical protein
MKRLQVIIVMLLAALTGCGEKAAPYGREQALRLPGTQGQVWAVAPVLNLSGEPAVDPLLQSDLLFQQMQQVRGLTVIPVNRVVEVYHALQISQVQSEEQAAVVCQALGADALVVATVTIYDPFNPPKMGASLQVLRASGGSPMPPGVDPREVARSASPQVGEPLPVEVSFDQAVVMFDAANGSVREALQRYAAGRHEPQGPLGLKEYYVNMDRYCGFVYHELIAQLLKKQGSR